MLPNGTKKKIAKMILLLLVVISVLFLRLVVGYQVLINLIPDNVLVSLLGTNDWEYNIADDYCLVNFGGTENVRLMRYSKDNDLETVIERHVFKYWYNNSYISCVQQDDNNTVYYYIINLSTDEIIKTSSHDEYVDICDENAIITNITWSDTSEITQAPINTE